MDDHPERGWLRAGPALDAVVVAAVLALDLGGMTVVSAGGAASSAGFGAVPAAAALAGAGALWWRRRRPFLALAIACSAIGVAADPGGLLSHHTGLLPVVALFAVGSWSEHRRWVVAVTVGLALLLHTGARDDGQDAAQAASFAAGLAGLPVVAGHAARARRRELEAVERRLAEVERSRDEQARRAVVEERAHIARELHDVVAHHVSLIGVQAGAARVALSTSPDATRAALLGIEASSREAVGQMRHLLDALRDEPGGEPDPQPGLADLDHLTAGFERAGLVVAADVRIAPGAEPLGPALQLVGYRIVEEALTNVARHSSAASASVVVEVDAGAVRISVADPGPPRFGTAGSGRGQVGMGERVALFDGLLAVGPDGDGGYRVEATIPRERP